MWSNYLLTSLRILKQNYFFVLMNMIALSIAFALCTIGYFNYQFNSDFNKYFPNADNLLKVNSQKASASGGKLMGTTPLPLAESIREELSGLNAARYTSSSQYVKLGEDMFRERAAFVDKEFLEMFHYMSAGGRPAKFHNNTQVYITQEAKQRLFGAEDATGKSLEIVLPNHEKLLLTVAGVLLKLPQNTSFVFDFIIPFENYITINQIDQDDWSIWVEGTFIQKSNADNNAQIVSQLSKYLPYQNEVNKQEQVSSYHVTDILKWSNYESSMYKSAFRGDLHPASVAGTISSAVAVLLLALFNFINTSLAISRKRLKEIGVRKVIGGGRRDLKIQFIMESFAQIFVALLFSVIVTFYLAQAYNAMFSFDIVEYDRISLVPFGSFILLTWLFAGLLAGIYPAFYISKFKPVEILKSKVKFSRKNLFTKSLITIQFAVCVYNVFALIVFIENTNYQNQLDRGYDVDQSINVSISRAGQFVVLKNELETWPAIDLVTGTSNSIGFGIEQVDIKYQSEDLEVSSLGVGVGYLESLGVKLLQGNYFTEGAHNSDNIIINEMLDNQLGGQLLNSWIYYGRQRFKVVGIVKNFNLKPIMLSNKIAPTVMFFSDKEGYNYANIKVANKDVNDIDKQIKEKWSALFPDEIYTSFMQEEVLFAVNQTNKIMLSINSFVAFILLFITSLGLYAQVSMNTQSRIKEFGVRKVLGAPIYNILYLINKEIMIMLLIASIIGLIGGDIAISAVMDIVYAYHKEIKMLNFVWPIIIIVGIMTMVIAQIVIKAAKANPVEQLRAE